VNLDTVAARPTRSPKSKIVLVPGVLALLPQYTGIEDPVAELRAACLEAVRWLGPDVRVIADPQGTRVAAYLMGEVLTISTTGGPSVLVVGNGSAKRTEKAPGHLDDRALPFDESLGAGLRAGDLTDVDLSLAGDLWASVEGISALGELLHGETAIVDYDDDPFGVQYWVMRWECAS
jgi:hypothetical protein